MYCKMSRKTLIIKSCQTEVQPVLMNLPERGLQKRVTTSRWDVPLLLSLLNDIFIKEHRNVVTSIYRSQENSASFHGRENFSDR